MTFVKEKSGLQLWKNNQSVITWFNNIPNKKDLKFIQFDICDFYPSITKDLILKAIGFAEKYIAISDDDKELFLHTKKSFLFSDNQAWIKKENKSCDVTMGSYDGAETCELVDLYLLSLCTKVIPDLGMYRDDGLAVTRSTARQREKLKQELIKVFQREELKITTEANIHSVNFLDVNLDLKTGLHKPYMKPNSTSLYVHSLSNHPKKILQNVPLAVNERLNRISSNQAVFSEAAPVYQEAL